MENPDGYTDDWRFSPVDKQVVPYIYKYDATADTATFYAGSAFDIQGATQGLLAAGSTLGAIAALLVSF